MCTHCGCGQVELEHKHEHEHTHEDGHTHHHDHEHTHHRIEIEQAILAENDQFAQANRHYFHQHSIAAINLLSSPGSGKTTLLVKTLQALKNKFSLAVIEGDQQTSLDADKIAATGVPVKQINTGKGCHLDAHQISHTIEDLQLANNSLLFIENVGNLVCPALFDLGEAAKVVVLSVTEGIDKPLKYPNMFAQAKLMIINKIDLLPYVDFSVATCIEYARRINPELEVIELSATTGQGFEQWLKWAKETTGNKC